MGGVLFFCLNMYRLFFFFFSTIMVGVGIFTLGGEFRARSNIIRKVVGWRHRVPPAGLPIEQVLGEYSLSLPL